MKFYANPLKIVVLLAIALLILLFWQFFISSNDKIVFVDNSKIFENFNMTRELKQNGEKELTQRVKYVDSLYAVLNDETNDSQELVNHFIEQKQQLESFEEAYVNQESQKVWKRINSYAAEFARQKGYKIILGMQPTSNIIYGDEENDVSAEFLTFINNKYEGNK